MRRLALVASMAALAGCAHHLPFATPPTAHALAGVPIELGTKAEPVPEGTKVHWAFGDGQEANGAVVTHAFGRAGDYSVVETITDGDGDRKTTLPVSVDRRSAWMAVPPGVRSALVLDRMLNRLPRLLAFLSQLSSPERIDNIFGQIASAVGFDPRVPAQVVAAGVDADKGVAWVNFEEEPNTNYFLVGVYDTALADQTLRKALVAANATFVEGPSGWSIAQLSGQSFHFRFERGFLIVRLPNDDKPEPPLALTKFAAAPDLGILTDPAFTAIHGAGEPSDAEYLVGRSALVPADSKPSTNAAAARVIAGMQQALVTMDAKEHELLASGHLALSADGQAAAAGLFGGTTVPTLASRAPPRAAAYASFSGDVSGMLELVAGSSGGNLLDQLLGHGVALQILVALIAGDAAVAGYFDPGEFFRSLMATQSPFPRGDLLLGATTRGGAPPLPLIEAALAASKTTVDKQQVGKATKLVFAVDGHPAGALIDGQDITLSYGTRTLEQLAKLGPTDARLETELRAALPAEAFTPGRLVAYLNVARLREQLSSPDPIPGLSGGEMIQAQVMAQMAAAQFASIRDAGLIVKPGAGGLEAWFRLRLQ